MGELTARLTLSPSFIAHWITGPLFHEMKKAGIPLSEVNNPQKQRITPEMLVELLRMIDPQERERIDG